MIELTREQLVWIAIGCFLLWPVLRYIVWPMHEILESIAEYYFNRFYEKRFEKSWGNKGTPESRLNKLDNDFYPLKRRLEEMEKILADSSKDKS